MCLPIIRSPRFGVENTSRAAPARHRSCSPIRGCRRSARASSSPLAPIGRSPTRKPTAPRRTSITRTASGSGVPEGGKDYAFGDTFPHEALFDQLAGVSFTKGCYVGQEVVSRMKNRGTTRKRVVPVVGRAALPAPGAPIAAGDVEIGTLGSIEGEHGLALVRIDRVGGVRGRRAKRCAPAMSPFASSCRAGPRSRSPRRLRRREPRPHERKVARRSRPLPVGRRRHRVPPLSRRRVGRAADCATKPCLRSSSWKAFRRACRGSPSCGGARPSAAPSRTSIPSASPTIGQRDVARLMKDEGIVRNRAKIEATIDNAKAYAKLRERTSLKAFLWGFLDDGPVQNRHKHDVGHPGRDRDCRSASPRL